MASRVIEDPVDWTKTRASATRAPLASWTSPRSVPFGFWAYELAEKNIPQRNIAIAPQSLLMLVGFDCI
jgi:hypothetical protein